MHALHSVLHSEYFSLIVSKQPKILPFDMEHTFNEVYYQQYLLFTNS